MPFNPNGPFGPPRQPRGAYTVPSRTPSRTTTQTDREVFYEYHTPAQPAPATAPPRPACTPQSNSGDVSGSTTPVPHGQRATFQNPAPLHPPPTHLPQAQHPQRQLHVAQHEAYDRRQQQHQPHHAGSGPGGEQGLAQALARLDMHGSPRHVGSSQAGNQDMQGGGGSIAADRTRTSNSTGAANRLSATATPFVPGSDVLAGAANPSHLTSNCYIFQQGSAFQAEVSTPADPEGAADTVSLPGRSLSTVSSNGIPLRHPNTTSYATMSRRWR